MHLRVGAADQCTVIPGADVLADVAACHPGTQGFGDPLWQLSVAVFDRVVRQAPPSIHHKRFSDGICRAGLDAGGAAAAKAACWLVRLQLFSCEKMTDHHP